MCVWVDRVANISREISISKPNCVDFDSLDKWNYVYFWFVVVVAVFRVVEIFWETASFVFKPTQDVQCYAAVLNSFQTNIFEKVESNRQYTDTLCHMQTRLFHLQHSKTIALFLLDIDYVIGIQRERKKKHTQTYHQLSKEETWQKQKITNKPATALQIECGNSTKMQTHRLPLKINFKALLVNTQSTLLLTNNNNNNNDGNGNAQIAAKWVGRKPEIRTYVWCTREYGTETQKAKQMLKAVACNIAQQNERKLIRLWSKNSLIVSSTLLTCCKKSTVFFCAIASETAYIQHRIEQSEINEIIWYLMIYLILTSFSPQQNKIAIWFIRHRYT